MLLVCSPKSRQAWRGGRGAAGGLTAGLCTPQGPAAVARFRAATRRADTCGAQQGTWEERLASFAAHQIRSDPSPVYGGGARAALDAFQRLGLPALLAHVRKSKPGRTNQSQHARAQLCAVPTQTHSTVRKESRAIAGAPVCPNSPSIQCMEAQDAYALGNACKHIT